MVGSAVCSQLLSKVLEFFSLNSKYVRRIKQHELKAEWHNGMLQYDYPINWKARPSHVAVKLGNSKKIKMIS